MPMSMNKRSLSVLALVFLAGLIVGRVQAQDHRVFELRKYTAPEGKLGELEARFRNHTIRIFNKHNMTSIGYFVPQDAPDSQNTLVYILAHPSREAAKKNWASSRRIRNGRRSTPNPRSTGASSAKWSRRSWTRSTSRRSSRHV
jgi:hypothetical protein